MGCQRKRDFERCKVIFGAAVHRLLTTAGTEPVQWTLAFHATEQPVDPFIGIWNFGRGEFEDANLNLQQRDGYEYARISRLEIMPLSLAENEEHDPKTSPRPKLELVDQVPDTIFSISQTISRTAKTMMEQEIAPTQETDNNSKHSKPGPRRAAAVQLSPPLTIASKRDHSKSAKIEKVHGSEMTPNKKGHSTSPSTEDSCRSIPPKRLGTKRKPKRPLQLFEDVTSSLPPTQVIGESQSLGQRSQTWNHRQSADEPTTQDWLVEVIPGSVSPEPLRIFDGISLSPEALSDAQTLPGVDLLRHDVPSPNIAYQLRLGSSTNDGALIRLEPPPSVTNGQNCMSQGELRASASAKLLDITISDDEQDLRMVAVEEHHALSHTAAEEGEGLDISYNFSPHTVSRRASLFQDIPNSSEDEE
ncbi:uncharacterized protein P884DRAFT_307637 [Thermothelomyces heterothallicus CBS 202.75]|uniref:uncharacterized protein n=1 Tax=Thermothelomyces heterothallicus CBS 202.75 TaxID=1149848 RepID=UPI0037444136